MQLYDAISPLTNHVLHSRGGAGDPFKYPSVELEAQAQALHDQVKTDPVIYPTRTPLNTFLVMGLTTAGTATLPEDDDVVNVKWLLKGTKALSVRFALADLKTYVYVMLVLVLYLCRRI